jgi:ribonucleoside-diphosphate reductase alpha chain
MTKFNNDFSKEVYEDTYHFEGNDVVKPDGNINGTQSRVAAGAAKAEKKESRGNYAKKFLEIQQDFAFVPGGRITSNAGTSLKGTTMINCFVSGPGGTDQDSIKGIMRELSKQAFILKSEGGYGFCSDFMRPRGAYINGIGVESPGAVEMLHMWDTQSSVITKGAGVKKKNKKGKNKIRKGAMMVTMSVWHPSIREFITAKQESGELTKFNMSVLVPDNFMKAVKKNKKWKLEFPQTDHERYEEEWDGNLELWKEKGYPTEVYEEVDAMEIWDLIMTSTYTRNEPGILFVDTINRKNNLKYCEHITATNPCGEQMLPVGGSCLLGSINLTQYVLSDFTGYDYEKLKADIPTMVRFLDNINDVSNYPLEEQKEQALQKRRIGLGYLGYGSSLYLLGLRYGDKKTLKVTEELCSFVTNEAYRASAILAKEKGAFPLFNLKEFLKSDFIKVLDKETIDLIKKNGLRNSHLTSIQPTGNSSVFANNVSSGLEPIFLAEYIRTHIVSVAPDGLDVPKVDFIKKTYTDSEYDWEWVQEGDEDLLKTIFNKKIYKIDRNRGLLKEEKVQDYALKELEAQGISIEGKDWAVNTSNLKIKDHIDTMHVFSKYIDSAMSKTVNLPEDFPYEDFKDLYMGVFQTGTIKGCTTYRAGTMATVLSSTDSKDSKKSSSAGESGYIKRPKTLPCDIHQLTVGGEEWIVLVGLLDENPYEIFAFKNTQISLKSSLSHGELTKVSGGKYKLECGGWVLQDVRALFESDEQDALTRLISTSLRNGVDVEHVVSQLQKAEGSVVSFSKAIARTLKKHIKDLKSFKCLECGGRNMALEDGCFKCLDCGGSKCS